MRVEFRTAVAHVVSGAFLLGGCGDDPGAPPQPVASVSLSLSADTVQQGTTRQLSVDIRDATNNPLPGRPVAWLSSDPAVAMVDATGLVTGLDNGFTIVSATVEGIADSARFVIWVGITGSYDGIVSAPDCNFDMSIGQATDGSIAGSGVRDLPCGEDRFSIVGVRGVGGVADSVEMTWSGSISTLNLAATFDGQHTLTGAIVSGDGCTPAVCPFTMDRYLVVARARSAPARRAAKGSR
jgi:hypothetical protein